MNDQDLLLRLYQVVAKGLRHKHYAHVVAKRKRYMQLVAGVGTDKLLKQYVRRESKELFDQRVALTNHIVTSVCKNLLDVFYKVPRSNSANRILTYASEDDQTEKIKEMENMLDNFWGQESWDDYMSTRVSDLISTDPNTFVVLEWDDFDNNTQLIQPRPYEVSSIDAVDYRYTNQVLDYLIAKDEHIYDDNTLLDTKDLAEKRLDPMYGKKVGSKYTLYGKNRTMQLRQISENAFASRSPGLEGQTFRAIVNDQPIDAVQLGGNYYQLIMLLPHDCGAVPAFRVGYQRDPQTNGHTYVNQIHAAQPYIEKTIKTNSELDLVATLLAMPQQISYGEECADTKCYGGSYPDGSTCKSCGGTGMKATAPSAQDAIKIKMPDSKEEMIPLKEIMTYLHPPVDIVKWQDEYIDKLTDKARKIMFNSEIFSRHEVQETATGKSLDMQNVYDTLYPFARKYGRDWTYGVKVMAKLANRDKDLVASLTFGKDFKLKTLDSLIFDLTRADKLSSSILTSHVDADIANIILAEKPLELQRYRLKTMYDPFSGKSEAQILYLMASPYVTRRHKVLHANFSAIFDELEIEYGAQSRDFYRLKRTEQVAAIESKVDEWVSRLDEDQPPTPRIPLEN